MFLLYSYEKRKTSKARGQQSGLESRNVKKWSLFALMSKRTKQHSGAA